MMTTTNKGETMFPATAADEPEAFDGCLGDLLAETLFDADIHPGEILINGVGFAPMRHRKGYTYVEIRGNGNDPWIVRFWIGDAIVRTERKDTRPLIAMLRAEKITY